MAALVSRHTVSRQFEYSYIHVRPRDPSNQRYALFLHGWPSSAHEWHHQIKHFSELGFGVIAPDCLGYGGTSCPAEVEHYRMKAIAQDIIDILDHENIGQVHGIGHDFGCYLLGRLGVYFPERFVTFSFLGLSYRPPGAFFDVDAVNKMTADRFGYSFFGYMKWFNEAPDVGKLLDKHHESIESLIYAADPELWKTHLGPVGALEEWLKSGSRTKVAAYLTESDRSIRAKAFANDSGYGPTLNWYKAHLRNINYPDEKDIPEEKKILHQPILLITFARDFIGIPEMQAPAMAGYAPNLIVKMLDTAHWVQLEVPDEVNALLQSHILSV